MRIETVKLGPTGRQVKDTVRENRFRSVRALNDLRFCLNLPSDSFQQSSYLRKLRTQLIKLSMRLIWRVGGDSEFLDAVVELLIGGGDEFRHLATSFLP